MSSGTKKIEAPEISSGGVIGKVRKSESRKSKRIGKRKEDLYSGKIFSYGWLPKTPKNGCDREGSPVWVCITMPKWPIHFLLSNRPF